MAEEEVSVLESEVDLGCLEVVEDPIEVKDWFVYLVLCSNDSIYCGVTNDLAKRMKAHKRGTGSKYVRAKGFAKLLHVIRVYGGKSEACKLEYQVKQMNRNEKITFFMQHENLQF